MEKGEKEYRIALEITRGEIGQSSTSDTHHEHAIEISIWPILKNKKDPAVERHGKIATFMFSVTNTNNDKRPSADFLIKGICLGNNKPFRAVITPFCNSGYGHLIM